MFKSNCHTHTTYCDGKNTAREMVEAAVAKGFVSLGFSGHSPMKDKNSWTMSPDDVDSYKAEIAALKEEYRDKIDILCGIELDADYDGVDPEDFDYVISSVHQLKKEGRAFDVDHTAAILQNMVDGLYGGSFTKMSRCYFDLLADFVAGTKTDVVGHLDLITKFNVDTPLFDEGDPEYRRAATDCVDRILAARPDVLFEVNTGAMYRVGKKVPYPAEFILRHIYEKGGKITLTSDSHRTEAIDFGFKEATDFIRKCGFEEIYYLTSKGRKKFIIDGE